MVDRDVETHFEVADDEPFECENYSGPISIGGSENQVITLAKFAGDPGRRYFGWVSIDGVFDPEARIVVLPHPYYSTQRMLTTAIGWGTSFLCGVGALVIALAGSVKRLLTKK